jgi:hypothetical protein
MTALSPATFSFAERVCLWVSALGVMASAALRLNDGQQPIWVSDFSPIAALCALFLGAGVWLRRNRRAPRVSLFLVYFALFGIFTMAMTLFNASLLPLRFALIDHHLIAADAWLGFDWLEFVAWFQDWPTLSAFLLFVYGTHLVQISLMLVVLSGLGWRARLEEMTMAAIIGASLTVGFWAFFPSFGPSPHLPVPEDIARAVGLEVADHAAFMMRAATEGITTMTGENLAGLVRERSTAWPMQPRTDTRIPAGSSPAGSCPPTTRISVSFIWSPRGIVGFIAVAFTVYMRMELMEPGVQYMCAEGARLSPAGPTARTPNGHLWNVLVTAHGVLMMFFVVIPALFGGFGNYFMPLHIGAPDMAFPRLNNLSYWLYVAGSALAVCSLFAPGGGGDLGTGSGWAGCCTRRCPPPRPAMRWISRSSRSMCRVRRRSWARSTSSPPS